MVSRRLAVINWTAGRVEISRELELSPATDYEGLRLRLALDVLVNGQTGKLANWTDQRS